MKKSALINALAYELGLLLTDRFPGLVFKAWFQRMMAYCRADWSEWRAKLTCRAIRS
jgi:hypothetical protein